MPRGRPVGIKEHHKRLTAGLKQALLHTSGPGPSPLQVMIEDMRQKYAAGDISGAADRAADCAPYLHAKLSSTVIKQEDPFAGMNRDDVDWAILLLTARDHGPVIIGAIAEGPEVGSLETVAPMPQ